MEISYDFSPYHCDSLNEIFETSLDFGSPLSSSMYSNTDNNMSNNSCVNHSQNPPETTNSGCSSMSFRQSFDYMSCSDNTSFVSNFSCLNSNNDCSSANQIHSKSSNPFVTTSCNPKVHTILRKDETNLYSQLIGNCSSPLPTPPHSPPSSEHDLDNIIASFPEILEYPPSTLFPGVEDVLLDLENIRNGQFQDIKPYASSELSEPAITQLKPSGSATSLANQQSPVILKDSMWNAGGAFIPLSTKPNVKLRTLSENSEEEQTPFLSLMDDEKYNYFPDTPGVSDEDDKSDRFGLSPVHSNSVSPTGSDKARFILLSPKSLVNREHDYCGKVHLPQTSPPFTESDEEVDVVSLFDSRESHLLSARDDKEKLMDSSSSEQVKRQLHMAIHESIKTKQRRGRPSKTISLGSSIQTPLNISPVPSPTEVCGAKSRYLLTQGKPASYTKRMMEQHSEALKRSKRRKTYAADPDDDIEKRSNHNIMERNRRVYIRNLFESLRRSVPETQTSERASKVVILNKAREYVHVLSRIQSYASNEKENLIQKNLYLKKKLQLLRIR